MRFILLAVFSSVACAQAPLEMLTWSWEEGQRDTYTIREEMRQSIESSSANIPIQWVRTFRVNDEVMTVTPDLVTVHRTFEKITVEVDRAGRKIRYDSSVPDRGRADDPMIAPFASLAGRTIEFDLDHEGTVRDLRGGADAVDGMLDALGDRLGGQLGSIPVNGPTNETLRKSLEEGLRIIPGRAVRRGESWTTDSVLKMPLVGDLTTSMTHTLRSVRAGRTGRVATIESTGEMIQDAARLDAGVEAHLTESTLESSTQFDVDASRIDRRVAEVSMTWEIYVPSLEGTRSKMTQRLEQKATMTREK